MKIIFLVFILLNLQQHSLSAVINSTYFIDEFEQIIPFAGCQLSVKTDIGAPGPLLLNPGTTTFYRAADSVGTLLFAANQNVLLACPGSSNYVKIRGNGVREVTATCVSGKTFSVSGTSYTFNQLSCQTYPVEEDRTSGTCSSGKTLIKAGFSVSTGFVELYEGCHDKTLHNTIYTKLILTKDAAGFQTGVDRPDWIKGSFFVGLDPTNLYRRATQQITFTSLLGSAQLAEQYISLTNDYFLSKGHLVAKSDFLYGSQQLATFFYWNAVPQWQTFNGGNWNTLEGNCKTFAARIGQDLEVYTGTWGQTTLPNYNNIQTNLFLTTSKVMPVPQIFWKVLYHRSGQSGIAFVGLNNPYQTAAQAASSVRCTDICSQITWLTWSPKDLRKGYSYCCEVNDFRKSFPELPSFTVNSILK